MADPQRYRDEANRVRWQAITTKDREQKETLLMIARLYDWLAARMANAALQSASVVRLSTVASPVVSQCRPSTPHSAVVVTFPAPNLQPHGS